MGHVGTRFATTKRKPTKDIFINGMDSIENAGGRNLRFTFVVLKVIDGKEVFLPLDWAIVMPREALPDAIGKALMAMGRQVLVSPSGTITVMH